MQDMVEMKNGARKTVQKKMFPGYVLINMVMNDDTWYVVRNTPGVTGFIGSSGKGAKPVPLLPSEIDTILKNMGMSRLDIDNELTEGEKVKVVDGPFKNMYGKIQTVDKENSTLTVLIDLFGQETPVDVTLSQVEKA